LKTPLKQKDRFYQFLYHSHTWASEGFFQRGTQRDFSKFFSGGAKRGEIVFFQLKTKKTTFLLNISKSSGGLGSPAPPFRCPCPRTDSHATYTNEAGFILKLK